MSKKKNAINWIVIVQAGYYLATAIWPFISRRSFEKVTGPKREWWLVKTVSALLGILATGMLLPGSPVQRKFLGAACAAVLGVIDIFYSSRKRISKVYLLDAVAEIALLIAWLFGSRRRRGHEAN